MANVKVSVIIPVYNAEKYLRECLDSVIEQTLQDLEIICVDDGSTDNSLSILQEYADRDERLKIVEQANQGAAAARNAGMAVTQGEYLAFLDADDLYYSEALQTAYACAEKSNADVLLFEADFFDEKQGLLRTEQVETKYLASLRKFSVQILPDYIFQIASCNTWNKLYKRKFVQRIGLMYQELKTANDLCFVYSAMACAERIAVLDKSLIKHRVLYSGNLQSVKVKTPLDFLLALKQLKKNLQQFGLWEQLKRSYLNCAMFHCLYNWQTLDKNGRGQIVANSRDIAELLEIEKHSADYYYNQNDYVLMCRVVGFYREGDLTIMGKLKNMLKHILPPPVNAFNREVAGIKQYMLELNAGLEAQQRQLQKAIDLLSERQKEQLAYIEQQQRFLSDKIRQNEELLNEIALHYTDIKSTLKDLTNRQNEILGGARWLAEEMGQSIKNNVVVSEKISGIDNKIQHLESGVIRLQKQPRLSYFVLNILDHCNLRCKGCDHFACIAEERFVSLENISNDVNRFSELMCGAVTRIGIMGGEPLLHPDLIEILKVTRQAFPDSLIQLVTNGLLLLRMSEEFWNCCSENDIVIVNTKYPINQKYDLMQQTAVEHNVKFEFYGKTGEVQKTSNKMPMDINGGQNPIKSFWECYHANDKPLLMEGKFYPCTVAPNVRHFNKKFGTAMELESGDYLDIYKINSAEEVFEFLSKPKPFCRYCMTDKRSFGHPWERSKQQMSEWI